MITDQQMLRLVIFVIIWEDHTSQWVPDHVPTFFEILTE